MNTKVVRPPEWNEKKSTKQDDGILHKIPVWGRTGTTAYESFSENLDTASEDMPLMRGLGRSYGDSSLPPAGNPHVLNTTLADRILAFDATTGLMRAEAGLSLYDLNWTMFKRGWFTPVTPGTQYVTLGGMVASDVHGKGHHVAGTFGKHVTALRMRVADGRILEVTRDTFPDLFCATLGGMGLTGHILEVEFKMRSIPSTYIDSRTEKIPNLERFLEALKTSAEEFPMTVGWIDTLATGSKMGRGILFKGRWATADQAPTRIVSARKRFTFPTELPSWALNGLTVKAFNSVVYNSHIGQTQQSIDSPESFFYPLDAIRHWNRMYGTRGFTQYQCVLPEERGPRAVHDFLKLMSRLGGASFLSVIKDCGAEGEGTLSFPMRGTSIAIDIPLKKDTQELINRLNAFVIKEGGRIYLTKDTLTRREDFEAMEGPRIKRFQEIRKKWDPELSLKSAQSIRLFGDPS